MEKIIFDQLREQSFALKESLRTLKTNISFSGDGIKKILVTSAVPNEGKSTVVMDLARSLAESQKRVLVIDCDMRKSVFIGRLDAHLESGEKILGLSHYLTGQNTLDQVMYSTNVSGLFMIFSGPSVPNPTEILENQHMKTLMTFAEKHFDYVLIDSPPVGAAIDAAVLAKNCDGAILVIAQGQVSSRVIINVKKQMEKSGVRILGAVLNKVDMSAGGRYGYYGKYYGSYYGHGDSKGQGK